MSRKTRKTKFHPDVQMLANMLAYKRPAGSDSEESFIKRFIDPTGAVPDQAGNLILTIGDHPRVLWSSHTDTVHRDSGLQGIAIDSSNFLFLANDKESNCLGADCTAGVWLMLEMIAAKKPGLYVFHRGEEIGGIGSTHIAQKTPALLDGVSIALAFDRRGTDSIITHQAGRRTASDAFALSLAEGLAMDHKPDPTGTFTDTECYAHIVQECSNLSVGYEYAHTPREELDTTYLRNLRDRLLALNVDHIEVARDPAEFDHGSYLYDWFDEQSELESLIKKHPDAAAELFSDYGIDADQFRVFLMTRRN